MPLARRWHAAGHTSGDEQGRRPEYPLRPLSVIVFPGYGCVMGVVGNQSMDLTSFREELLQRRREILENQKPLATSMGDTNTRQGDLADQATGNNEVHIHLKLKQTDAKILQAIEEALQRIEHGTYGVCRDCGEPIAVARLKAIPWTRVCIACKEKQKA